MFGEPVTKEEAYRWLAARWGPHVALVEIKFSGAAYRCQAWALGEYGGGKFLGSGGNWQATVENISAGRPWGDVGGLQ